MLCESEIGELVGIIHSRGWDLHEPDVSILDILSEKRESIPVTCLKYNLKYRLLPSPQDGQTLRDAIVNSAALNYVPNLRLIQGYTEQNFLITKLMIHDDFVVCANPFRVLFIANDDAIANFRKYFRTRYLEQLAMINSQ